jgi:hypothetical protein
MYQKSVAQGIGMAVMAALLAGCSMQSMEMSDGPVNMSHKPMRSVVMQGIVKDGDHNFTNNCPLPSYHCGPYLDEKYTGPGDAYAYAAQEGDSTQAAQTLIAVTHSGPGAMSMAGTALGVDSIVNGSVLGPAGIAASLLLGGALDSGNKVHGPTAMADYNAKVQSFNRGQMLWVARYYPDKQWQAGMNQTSHLAIAVSDGLHPVGWAGATDEGHLYRIRKGWRDMISDDSFEWAWLDGAPAVTPKILPTRMMWIIQPWKTPSDPYYIVNKAPGGAKWPFMALATIEYRIQPGFDIPQWISAHSSQLADWMVIYHQGDKAVVWKNGQTVSYALPTPMAIPAKLKAK